MNRPDQIQKALFGNKVTCSAGIPIRTKNPSYKRKWWTWKSWTRRNIHIESTPEHKIIDYLTNFSAN